MLRCDTDRLLVSRGWKIAFIDFAEAERLKRGEEAKSTRCLRVYMLSHDVVCAEHGEGVGSWTVVSDDGRAALLTAVFKSSLFSDDREPGLGLPDDAWY